MDPTPAPSWARGFSFNTFDLMSAHVKPPIATHFAYPLEPAKGLGASCGAGTAPADLTVTGPRQGAALFVGRAGEQHWVPVLRVFPPSGASRSVRGRTKAFGLAAVRRFAQRRNTQRALCGPSHRSLFHHRSSTLAKFPANSLLLVEKFPASCSKIPCSVA